MLKITTLTGLANILSVNFEFCIGTYLMEHLLESFQIDINGTKNKVVSQPMNSQLIFEARPLNLTDSSEFI